MIQPITQYQNYYFQDSRIIGITESELVDIQVLTVEEEAVSVQDFFVKDNIIYLETSEQENTGNEEEPVYEAVTHYYKQNNGIITEIEELPEKPTIGYTVYNSKNFALTQGEYQGEPISNIKNKVSGGNATFKQIFGVSEFSSNIFFNVIESKIPNKQTGLYVYPKDRKAVVHVSSALISGFLW